MVSMNFYPSAAQGFRVTLAVFILITFWKMKQAKLLGIFQKFNEIGNFTRTPMSDRRSRMHH